MNRREFSRLSTAAFLVPPLLVPASLAQGIPAGRTRNGKLAMGTNLSGMEWTRPGLRYGASTMPNVHFTVPRKADIDYLSACGYGKSRLPVQWELLQPMLAGINADAQAISLIGKPGEFHPEYAAYITGVLDAHAAAGMTCIIDLHNYCRYQDFIYQPNGSVKGLQQIPEKRVRPFTTDNSQVFVRIMSLAPGATLTQAQFSDVWSRAAALWKDHPGLGGYGLMNEPNSMPVVGRTEGTSYGAAQDLRIWPTYAQAAVNAIRELDKTTPIYVALNEYENVGALTPRFPLTDPNIIYEWHMYLDSRSSGALFDYDVERNAGFSVLDSGKAINPQTGVNRLRVAIQWAASQTPRAKIMIGEIGLPIDDPRWGPMFVNTIRYAIENNCEIFTWMGGNHWPIRNYAINQVPGWHQNRTVEPLVSGTLKAAAGMSQATLFDDGPGHSRVGEPVTITVYARGSLARPVVVEVSASGKGSLGKTRLTIPAGANGQDVFTFTPQAGQVATLRYSIVEAAGQAGMLAPPPRRVFSLPDPVAHAAGNLEEAAVALVAKYGASKWDMADGYTDYVQGAPAGGGQPVRAVSDSGYGSSPGNAMEMLNFINKDTAAMGSMALPVMRSIGGRKVMDCSAENTFGLWCKKSASMPGVQPKPTNRVPFSVEDPHFVIAAINVSSPTNTGVVFQTSKTEDAHLAELGLANGIPAIRFIDGKGQKFQLAGNDRLAPNAPAVLAYTSAPGAQKLRFNSAEVASGSARFAPSPCTQMLIGWGYANYYPQGGFGGQVYAVIAGKGAPTPAEMAVMERYLAGLAGAKLAPA
jgi:endoglucanase